MISDEKFGKKERLLKSKDFKKVYKNGRSHKIGPVILYHLANNLGHGRIGFSISARNVRRANSRNRIKRLFREVYRKQKKYLREGRDIILIVKREPCKDTSYSKTEDLFLKLARGARILA